MYADANDGKFPSGFGSPANDLFQLYPSFANDPRVYLNPRANKAVPAVPVMASGTVASEWLNALDYTYLPGVDPMDGTRILAYERIPIAGGRNVLVVAGSVEFMDEASFQKALKQQLAEEASRP
ncbi:MAG: hypothetical protein HY291_04355 [Planctomycetes bacterium]|nr:hypothetical protein [Planctomycetota bacterium]